MLASQLTTDQLWIDSCTLSADPFEDTAMLRVFVGEDGVTGPNRITKTSTLAARARIRSRARTGLAAGTAFRPGRERATLANTGRKDAAASPVAELSPDRRAQDTVRVEQIVAKAVAEMAKAMTEESAHRISSPVRTPVDPRAKMTLRGLYEESLKSERESRVANGRNKSGTGAKDISALSCWERNTGNPPLESIDGTVIQGFIMSALSTGRRSTARGYVGHLRWMLNEARRAGIIAAVPAFGFPKVSRRAVNEEHRETLIYEIGGDLLGTLDKIHAAITDDELRLAFVCGASFGPRTEDLLTLTWANFDLTTERPVVRFVAEKTGTFHVVPLAPWLAAMLTASKSDETHVFPTLISHKSKDPRKSRASRRAVSGLKAAALAAGFEFAGRKPAEQKPFQVLRATCNERFERHHRRAGEWILGHGMTGVNRASYQNPGSDIYTAVNSLPQPSSFLKGS